MQLSGIYYKDKKIIIKQWMLKNLKWYYSKCVSISKIFYRKGKRRNM